MDCYGVFPDSFSILFFYFWKIYLLILFFLYWADWEFSFVNFFSLKHCWLLQCFSAWFFFFFFLWFSSLTPKCTMDYNSNPQCIPLSFFHIFFFFAIFHLFFQLSFFFVYFFFFSKITFLFFTTFLFFPFFSFICFFFSKLSLLILLFKYWAS